VNRQELEAITELTRVVGALRESIQAADRMAFRVATGDVGAQLGGLPEGTVRGLIESGDLPAVLAGRHLIVSRAAIERYLSESARARAA
jgi:excisionase family DNA binding protein